MKVKDFSLATVTTFLEYLYASAFNKDFDKTMITPELMTLSHMYSVQCLYDITTKHLKENICDTDAIKLWFEAKRIKSEDMMNSAVEFFVNQMEDIASLADVESAYECPELMRSIFAFIAKNGKTIIVRFTHENTSYEKTTYEVSIKTIDTIRSFKEVAYRKVVEKIALSEGEIKSYVQNFKMFTKGMEMLDDNRTLKSYGIRDGSDNFILKGYRPQ